MFRDGACVILVNPCDVAGQTVSGDSFTGTGRFQRSVHAGHRGVGPVLVAKHFGHVAKAKPDTVDFVSVGGSNATTGGADFGIETVHVAVVGEDDVGSLADEEAFATRVFTGGLFPSAQFLVEHPRVDDHAVAEHQVAFFAGDA